MLDYEILDVATLIEYRRDVVEAIAKRDNLYNELLHRYTVTEIEEMIHTVSNDAD